MSGHEKKPLVPRLRFPEFREEGEWAKKSLADVCLRITNGKANAEDHEEDGVYPLFDRSEVIKKSSDFAFDDEAVIIPGEGMRFQPKYYQGKFNLHQRAYALMQHKGVAKFVYYTLDRFKDTLAKNAVKSTVLSLRLPIIEKFGLAVPNKGEQQKIADCLSSLDDLITAETQKLDTLKTHKKGLMQQLFPREGETVPRLRFPEFREAPAWGKEKLEKLITTVSPPSKLQSSNYGTQGKFPIIDQSQEFICGWTDDERAVITESLPLIIFGDHTCALKFVDKPFAQGADGIKILKVRPAISAEYLFHSLSHRPLAMEDYKRHFSMLKERAVVFPDIESGEQQKIADCLSSLDDLITAQTQKIDALKTHKKGLMQQLFPTLDEVDA